MRSRRPIPSGILLGALAALVAACGEPGEVVSGDDLGVSDTLALADADNAAADLDLRIEQLSVAAETDVLIDWSTLGVPVWSGGSGDVEVSDRASLRFFPGKDLAALTDGLVAGTLAQSDVALDLQCESAVRACALSGFTLAESHAIDVVSLFLEAPGTWLVTIGAASSAEVVAYLALSPSTHSSQTVAAVTAASTEAELALTPSAAGPLAVPADGYVEVDWSGITRSCRGLALQPYQVDRLVVTFLPGVDPVAPGADLAAQLAASSEVWSARASGGTRFALPELAEEATGEVGFPGFEGQGTWVLTLWASSTGDPSPAFLALLQP